MLRHTDECRELGVPFAADPSQQLARMDGPEIRRLVEGARYLLTNDYEWELLLQKTGWTEAAGRASGSTSGSPRSARRACEIVGRDVRRRSRSASCPRPARSTRPVSATGSARASSPAIAGGLSLERAAQLGSLIAVQVLETDGPQEWTWDRGTALERLRDAYGPDAAAEIAAVLPA